MISLVQKVVVVSRVLVYSVIYHYCVAQIKRFAIFVGVILFLRNGSRENQDMHQVWRLAMNLCQNIGWKNNCEYGAGSLVRHIWSGEPLGLGWNRGNKVRKPSSHLFWQTEHLQISGSNFLIYSSFAPSLEHKLFCISMYIIYVCVLHVCVHLCVYVYVIKRENSSEQSLRSCQRSLCFQSPSWPPCLNISGQCDS